MTINSTINYDIFKDILGNRDLMENHIMKLVKSIASNNLLAQHPIIVNEKMEVIDGQHRLEAAKKLSVPIYYTISRGSGLSDVHRLNTTSRSWKTMDYIQSYIHLGKKDYKELLEFIEENEISVEIVLNFLSEQGGTSYQRLKEGKFAFTDAKKEFAQECATFYNQIKPYFEQGYVRKAYLSRSIVKVIVAGKQSDINKKIGSREGVELKHQNSTREYLRQFEDVLNFKTSGNQRLF